MGKKKEPVLAYNVKTKQKEEMTEIVIDITSRGTYFSKGKGVETGANLCAAMGKDKALALIEEGDAEKGKGWPEEKPKKKK